MNKIDKGMLNDLQWLYGPGFQCVATVEACGDVCEFYNGDKKVGFISDKLFCMLYGGTQTMYNKEDGHKTFINKGGGRTDTYIDVKEHPNFLVKYIHCFRCDRENEYNKYLNSLSDPDDH